MTNSPLWIARTPHLLLPSPYLLHPSPTYLLNDLYPLYLALERLTAEEDNQELLETQSGRELLRYRQLVAGEFMRRFVDSKFPHWEAAESMKSLLELELDLWISNFRMLERLQALNPLFAKPHFAILFGSLIVERKLMVLISICPDEPHAVKNYIALLQSQNRRLQGYENPFQKDRTPRTWEVVEQVIATTEQNYSFRKEFYLPVVRARQKFVTYMKSERFRAYFQGKLQKQGRKKQKGS